MANGFLFQGTSGPNVSTTAVELGNRKALMWLGKTASSVLNTPIHTHTHTHRHTHRTQCVSAQVSQYLNLSVGGPLQSAADATQSPSFRLKDEPDVS